MVGSKPVKFIVNDRETEVALIDNEGTVYKSGESDFDFRNIASTMREVEAYIEAYENAPELKDEWRTLSSHMGQYVLAAKMDTPKTNPMRFVTWQRNDRGVTLGHYYSSFAAAEKDFMDRCGYEKPLFTEQELKIIHCVTSYMNVEMNGVDSYNISSKIEALYPAFENDLEGDAEFN